MAAINQIYDDFNLTRLVTVEYKYVRDHHS